MPQGSQHTVFGELSHGFPLESPSPASSVRWAPRKVWPQGKVLDHMGPGDVQPSEARPGGWTVAARLWGACWGRWRRGAGATPHKRRPHRRGREVTDAADPRLPPPRPYPGDTFIHLGLISTNASQHLWLRRARSPDPLYPLEDLRPPPAPVSHPQCLRRGSDDEMGEYTSPSLACPPEVASEGN